jgi:uncharacterized membrane protein YgaE (UPF0421/DUF939 family)
MLGRLFSSILAGLGTFFVVWVLLAVLSAVLPGISINAWAFGVVVGIIAGVAYFFSGKNPVL